MNTTGQLKIGVVAPAGRITPETAARVEALAATYYPKDRLEIVFHPQCFASDGHFAGNDAFRTQAFLEYANDPGIDALWWARGGYGSARLAEAIMPSLSDGCIAKTYLGYSDAGSLLAVLYSRGCERVTHGPMVNDMNRQDGDAAVLRALAWLVDGNPAALEPSLIDATAPVAAFNMSTLCHLIGTPFQPDLTGHVLMLEEVSEHLYRIDRLMFQITSNEALRRVAGIRLGRCSDVPLNDPDFGMTALQIVQHWCRRTGIAWLGPADIGHDIANKLVPFGRQRALK